MADPSEKWDAYPHTILEFPIESGRIARIDLRAALTDVDLATLRTLGLARPFAVFTAQNPNGDNADDAPGPEAARAREAENAAREEALEAGLRAIGIPFQRVDGVAPDGGYREHCVAAVMDQETAARTAARLEQLALFWFDGTAFWLLPAEVDEPAVRLPKGAGG